MEKTWEEIHDIDFSILALVEKNQAYSVEDHGNFS